MRDSEHEKNSAGVNSGAPRDSAQERDETQEQGEATTQHQQHRPNRTHREEASSQPPPRMTPQQSSTVMLSARQVLSLIRDDSDGDDPDHEEEVSTLETAATKQQQQRAVPTPMPIGNEKSRIAPEKEKSEHTAEWGLSKEQHQDQHLLRSHGDAKSAVNHTSTSVGLADNDHAPKPTRTSARMSARRSLMRRSYRPNASRAATTSELVNEKIRSSGAFAAGGGGQQRLSHLPPTAAAEEAGKQSMKKANSSQSRYDTIAKSVRVELDGKNRSVAISSAPTTPSKPALFASSGGTASAGMRATKTGDPDLLTTNTDGKVSDDGHGKTSKAKADGARLSKTAQNHHGHLKKDGEDKHDASLLAMPKTLQQQVSLHIFDGDDSEFDNDEADADADTRSSVPMRRQPTSTYFSRYHHHNQHNNNDIDNTDADSHTTNSTNLFASGPPRVGIFAVAGPNQSAPASSSSSSPLPPHNRIEMPPEPPMGLNGYHEQTMMMVDSTIHEVSNLPVAKQIDHDKEARGSNREIVTATGAPDEKEVKERKQKRKRIVFTISGLVVVLAAIIIALMLTIFTSRHDDGAPAQQPSNKPTNGTATDVPLTLLPSQQPTSPVSASPSQSPTQPSTFDRIVASLKISLNESLSDFDESELYDPSTIAFQTLDWMANTDEQSEIILDSATENLHLRMRDRYILTYFAVAMDAPKWKLGRKFMTNIDTCLWNGYKKGVECDSAGIVSLLQIHENELKGTLFPLLFMLDLESLVLRGNDIRGTISPLVGNMKKLKELDISECTLTGTIPTEIGELIQLTKLELNKNNGLRGPIPSEVGRLNNLNLLSLHTNKLSGTIPPELGMIPQLELLHLRKNQFIGTVPSVLSTLSKLDSISLDDTFVVGNLDPIFCDRPSHYAPFILLRSDCIGSEDAPSRTVCSCCLRCCREGVDCMDEPSQPSECGGKCVACDRGVFAASCDICPALDTNGTDTALETPAVLCGRSCSFNFTSGQCETRTAFDMDLTPT